MTIQNIKPLLVPTYRGGLATNNKSDGWKYIRHNYAKVPDTGAWMNAQTENWGKFIDKNMNNGKVNQELWAASVRDSSLKETDIIGMY